MKLTSYLVFACAAILVFAVGCAREVHETRDYYKVEPNVRPATPMESNITPAPKPLPSSPYQPTPAPYQPTPTPAPYQPTPTPVPYDPTPTPVPYDPTPTPVPYDPTPTPAPTPGNQVPDWANQTLRVTGQSAADSNRPAGQAKLLARRGAQLDAQRNLLEQVLGLRIDSKTVVKDMMTESDEINAETSGMIKGCNVVGEHFDGSIYTVNMELNLYNVYEYLKVEKKYYR